MSRKIILALAAMAAAGALTTTDASARTGSHFSAPRVSTFNRVAPVIHRPNFVHNPSVYRPVVQRRYWTPTYEAPTYVAPTYVAPTYETPKYVVSTPPKYHGPVCENGCDEILNDGSGCYMAKRKFSTPHGDELRCVKICDATPGPETSPEK